MHRRPTYWAALFACAAAVFVPTRARAEASAAQKAAAESLFDDALKSIRGGHYADACPKLEQSERIDPGIGTLLYLGDCYEKTGRTASGWATFREAASVAQAQGESERARIAAARADRLQPNLSKLTITVDPGTAQLAGLHVTRDNAPVEASLFGLAIPVDPGRYHIVANADGRDQFQTDLDVAANGDAKSVQIPALKTSPIAAGGAAREPANPNPSAGALVPSAGTLVATPNGDGAPGKPSNAFRTAAYVTGAVGIVGLGIGSYFGVRAISKNSDAETHCPRGNQCDDSQGVSLTNQAKSAAVASNITMVAGAAFAIAGIVLYLSSEPDHAARAELHPLLGRDVAGIGLSGAFH